MRNHLVAVFTLTSSMALAQAAEPQQQPATGDATAPAAEATTAPETPAEPTAEERMTNAEGKITSLEEQNVETKNDLSFLKKLKISGYVQARYQYQEPLQVMPGDTLSIACSWDTSDRDVVTRFGEGTGDEMCIAALYVSW